MGNLSTIGAAFASKTLTFAQANSIPVYFDNQKYEPPLKQRHLRAFFLPSGKFQAACGEDAPNKQNGVYKINIYVEPLIGYGPPLLLADAVATEFKRGTKIVKDGLEITITRAQVEQYIVEESWYIVPVSIYFYSYTPN